MVNRKNLLILFICICGFTAVYLYYVKKERLASIAQYFPHPQPGDIYKMQEDTREQGVIVFYLKIQSIDEQHIYFYRSRLVMGAIHDSLLRHFDTSYAQTYTKNDLADIVAGKWMIQDKDKTQLLEIERK
jgi:hypothetical protein